VNHENRSIDETCSTEGERRIRDACARFEAAWKSGAEPAIDRYLVEGKEPERTSLLRRLLLIELQYCGQSGETMNRGRYHELFPDDDDLIDSVFASAQARSADGDTLDYPAVDSEHAIHDTTGSLGSTDAGRQDRESRAVQLADVPEIQGYQVLDLIGRGGMGLVVKARDQSLNRLVAIKLPLPSQMASSDARERFLREARSAAALRHPHICPIYQVGEAGDRPYLAMGFIEGQSLDDWAKDRNVTPRQAAEVTAVLAQAVSYAHQRDLVHRDIKPANAMIDAETGKPVLMDFGLAKNLAEEDVQLTQSGQVMGTPVYMAPEQAAGRTDEIGPPADIYALGVVLYELLCGQRPFKGSFGEVLKQVQTSEPLAPRRVKPGLHRDLETVCLKAMAKEPERRYDSAAALAEDLERFCAGEAILARREPFTSKVARKIRRNPLAAASAVTVLLVIIVAALLTSRYLSVQRTSAIEREVDEHLNGPLLEEDYLRETEAKIAELQEFAPDQAEDARRRLNRQFESVIREGLRRPKLPQQEIARLEHAIELLEQRAPEKATPLRQALAQRQRNWQSIFQLAAPYSNVSEIFDTDQVELYGGQLIRAQQSSNSDGLDCVVLTRRKCPGNVELHAIFHRDWSSNSNKVGLVLNGSEQGGYRFILRAVDSSAESADDLSFDEVKNDGGQISLEIKRGGTILVEERRSPLSLGDGSLRLEARHEGNWLTFQVGDRSPLRFRDIFSASSREPGVFGLVWPSGVPLANLQGYRQTLPTAASPLEQGDELYLLGSFSEARDFYRQQAIASGDTPAGQEARYKQSLCLLALGRDNEAAKQFELLAAEGSAAAGESQGDWPLLATCRLWLLRLQQNRSDDAEAVYQSLSARYRFEQLAALIPEDLRRDIIKQYHQGGAGLNLLAFNPDRVRDLERAVEVERFLRVPDISHVHTKRSLLRAYRIAGQIDKAIRFAEQLVRAESVDELSSGDNLVEEYSWLMRLHGDPRQGLEEIDRRLFQSPGVYREEMTYLLVERARIHAALEQWDEAEHDIDKFFHLASDADGIDYHAYSAASLIRGFLRQRQDNESGAVEAWRTGYAAEGADTVLHTSSIGGRIALLNHMILASLSGQMTDAEAEAIVRDAFKSQGAGSAGAVFQSAVKLPPSVLREMWRTPRGRQSAEQMAFQTVTLAEYVRLPVFVTAAEYVRQNGFGHELSPEDETIVWDMAEQAFSAQQEGKIGATRLLQLGLAWKGTTNAFGWGGVQGSLEPELRASIAYIFGHRYRRLGKPAESASFFQTAEQDAPADSLVRRRARENLAMLDAN